MPSNPACGAGLLREEQPLSDAEAFVKSADGFCKVSASYLPAAFCVLLSKSFF
jgi:hypothetical protein